MMANNSSLPDHQNGGSVHYSSAPPGSDPMYVTELTHNDILLGRGAPIINYEGNVRFRELVRTRKKEYVGTGRHQIKDDIARQILEEITRRKGRFLRKVDTTVENVTGLDIKDKAKVWRVAEEDVAVEKVKQALRDKDPVKQNQSLPDDSLAGSSAGVGITSNFTGDLASVQGLAGLASMQNMFAPPSLWGGGASGMGLGMGNLNNGAQAMRVMPADQLTFMLQQRQDFMRQQHMNLLQSQLMLNQQLEFLRQQNMKQNATQSSTPAAVGGVPQQGAAGISALQQQQLFQQLATTPNAPAFLAALQANMTPGTNGGVAVAPSTTETVPLGTTPGPPAEPGSLPSDTILQKESTEEQDNNGDDKNDADDEKGGELSDTSRKRKASPPTPSTEDASKKAKETNVETV